MPCILKLNSVVVEEGCQVMNFSRNYSFPALIRINLRISASVTPSYRMLRVTHAEMGRFGEHFIIDWLVVFLPERLMLWVGTMYCPVG